MFIPSLAVQAAKRWRGLSAKVPTAAKSSATLTESLKSSDPATNRLHRLNNIASSEKARATVLEAETSADDGVSQTDVIRAIGQERIIGTRDLVDINFLELAVAVSRAVGRLQSQNVFATGCLVGPQLLITNNHVIADAASAATWLFQLDYQQNASGDLLPVQTFRVDPGYFFFTEAKLDFTMVGVKGISDKGRPLTDYPWVKLIADYGKIEAGDPINIIQHPMGGLKQIALRQNQVIALKNEQPDFLAYTTDTEPGSSGSPAFNDQWELVAVHHQSIPKTEGKQILTKDGKPWQKGESENDIDWIANEGVRVSATLKSLQDASLDSKTRAILSHALALSAPNPVELARTPGAAVGVPPATVLNPEAVTGLPIPQNFSGGITVPTQTTTFQIPLTISITLGEAIPNVGIPSFASVSTSSPPLPDETVTIDPDYASRPGYDPKFLGIDVPLPILSDAQVLETAAVTAENQADGDPHELRYWNYSVKMNSSRRTAWFSAANVDGDERYQMPKRSGDSVVRRSASRGERAIDTGCF